MLFFLHFDVNTTLRSVSVKVRNINVDFCVHIKECLLTENTNIVDLLQLKCSVVQCQSSGQFYGPPGIYTDARGVLYSQI